MKTINIIVMILVIIGAINWGLWGFFEFDFVAWLFGGHTTTISRVIYAIIGLAGLWTIGLFSHCCKRRCASKDSSCSSKDSSSGSSGCCK